MSTTGRHIHIATFANISFATNHECFYVRRDHRNFPGILDGTIIEFPGACSDRFTGEFGLFGDASESYIIIFPRFFGVSTCSSIEIYLWMTTNRTR
ncbi:hypothetical protein NY2A_b511L [Paramecium bursaria Chlorella virus NY2A]|uniref:Uncharacterized protein b511L n=1 Tax=Paramecium bursaria Chlorella virus NY2A TaxID=46021 RepID=A7IX36_PBCVN|nr:hypothetical protein NY2A_b511L [Paramecium bursaria Chlorella virus NY2A]ABT14910.1 hypothetical protein NY2A_b511L [Paramecium bursaria Chlorella virus NY2A]